MPSDHSSTSFQRVVGGLDYITLPDDKLVVLLFLGVVKSGLSFDGFNNMLAFCDFWFDEFVCVDVGAGNRFFFLG